MFRVVFIRISISSTWAHAHHGAMRRPNPPAPRLFLVFNSRPSPRTRRFSSAGEAQSGPRGLDRHEQQCRAFPLVSYKVSHPARIDLHSQIPGRVEVAVGAVRTVPQAGVLDVQQQVVRNGGCH